MIRVFQPLEVKLERQGEVSVEFAELKGESILRITLGGTCGIGSRGPNYGEYLYQHIGLALLQVQPIAVLVDLSELEYTFGDRILMLFEIFSDLNLYPETGFITAFVLSDKNKHGLASLLALDLENLKEGFFLDADEAFRFLWEAYDEI